MKLSDFSEWAVSENGWLTEIITLSKMLVLQDFNLETIAQDCENFNPDWSRLILIASILSQSESRSDLEVALTIAQAGVIISNKESVKGASVVLLNQLNNHRMNHEAIKRGIVEDSYLSKLGTSARILAFREENQSKIFSSFGEPIAANRFQIDFWHAINENQWLYALAPTASGKSYIVLKYVIEELLLGRMNNILYIAPTRALVSEIEANIRNLAIEAGLLELNISSIPIKELSQENSQCVYVFTQERLHIFLNTITTESYDLLIVDEIQKLSDGMRGVILQDAIEKVQRVNPNSKIIYLSPNAENPQMLFDNAPKSVKTKVVDRDQPMVTQNMIWASETNAGSTKWKMELKTKNGPSLLGNFELVDRPTTQAKKMALIAHKLTGNQTGSMIYANEPSEAEEIAEFIADLIGEYENSDLKNLSILAREGIHPNFKLVRTALKGVAFHYGNMPSLVREEIEQLFNKGVIRFLICTSTLIEGVNLSCKTIFVKGPTKGRARPMEDQDFWNLAGRAGRWGKEFQGNIVCIDPDVWKNHPPERTRFKLKRQTDEVLKDSSGLNDYLQSRRFEVKTIDDSKVYESVFAYLLTNYLRENNLDSLKTNDKYSYNNIEDIESRLDYFKDQIDIPRSIIDKHSGISAVSMQTLLNYFRSNYSAKLKKSKEIEKLIPLTPESVNAYDNMEGILRRIHLKLYPGFGFGQQYRHFAVLILNWMQGYTLRRLIESTIKHDEQQAIAKNKKTKSVHAIIRDTMREVEEYARFKAPKYIACYTDVLKLFLLEEGKIDLYPNDYPFDLFLEFGVMSKTLLSLVGLGLSRMTATELGEVILSSELNKEQCLQWLKENLRQREIRTLSRKRYLESLAFKAVNVLVIYSVSEDKFCKNKTFENQF